MIGPYDRVRINRQIDCQLANRRKLIALGECTCGDPADHLIDDLAVDRDTAMQVQAHAEGFSCLD